QKLMSINPDGVVGRDTRPLLFSAHDLNITIFRLIPPNPDLPRLVPGLRPLPGVFTPVPGLEQGLLTPLLTMPGKLPFPPITLAPQKLQLHVDNLQLGAQAQQTIQRIHSFSSLIVSANVTLLTTENGLHQELTFGPQVGFNSSSADSGVDGSLV